MMRGGSQTNRKAQPLVSLTGIYNAPGNSQIEPAFIADSTLTLLQKVSIIWNIVAPDNICKAYVYLRQLQHQNIAVLHAISKSVTFSKKCVDANLRTIAASRARKSITKFG